MSKTQKQEVKVIYLNKLMTIMLIFGYILLLIVIFSQVNSIYDLRQENERLYDRLINMQTEACYLKYPFEGSIFDTRNITSYMEAEKNTMNLKICRIEIDNLIYEKVYGK